MVDGNVGAGSETGGGARELDLREVQKPDRHPMIFATFADLAVGDVLELIVDHDPQPLHEQFEVEYPRGYAWDYRSREPGNWRIAITKLARTALPRIVADTTALIQEVAESGVAGAAWNLRVGQRDLDSNIIALPPGEAIDAHDGPEIDVLIHVLSGSGRLTTEVDEIDLAAGSLLWMPRRSRRQFTAGPDGLRYLTVHQRRQSLQIRVGPPTDAARVPLTSQLPESHDADDDRK